MLRLLSQLGITTTVTIVIGIVARAMLMPKKPCHRDRAFLLQKIYTLIGMPSTLAKPSSSDS
jgi:hypothetical protein